MSVTYPNFSPQQLVDKFNELFPIGTMTFYYISISRIPIAAKTTSYARLLDGDMPAVNLGPICGWVSLTQIMIPSEFIWYGCALALVEKRKKNDETGEKGKNQCKSPPY